MSDWKIAPAITALIASVNEHCPGRDHSSDGTIGDASHAARSSDHNPWVQDTGVGVVTACDITHDPAHGCDCERITATLRTHMDPRLKYVIWNHKIFSSVQEPWQWRPYLGKNGHTMHMHVSVRAEKEYWNVRTPWSIAGGILPVDERPKLNIKRPKLQMGDTGQEVRNLQTLLQKHGRKLVVDGTYGHFTQMCVMDVQANTGMHIDGICGPYTWAALESDKPIPTLTVNR